MTPDLIDILKDRLPQFLSTEDERFERDLAETASFGFFHQQAMGMTSEELRPTAKSKAVNERIKKAKDDVLKMEHEVLIARGFKPFELEEHFEATVESRQVIEDRKRAYVGWLILNDEYWHDLKTLQSKWGEYLFHVQRFPMSPRWHRDAIARPIGYDPNFLNDCTSFYLKWGLDCLYTWDWPDPMEPNFNIPSAEFIKDDPEISEAGVQLFIPWYLLRGDKLNMQQVVRAATINRFGDHLQGWLYGDSTSKQQLGDIRYRHIEFIYHYYLLIFRRRYPEKCKGNKERLDEVLASQLKCNAETVRKLRQELERCRGT